MAKGESYQNMNYADWRPLKHAYWHVLTNNGPQLTAESDHTLRQVETTKL